MGKGRDKRKKAKARNEKQSRLRGQTAQVIIIDDMARFGNAEIEDQAASAKERRA